MVFSDRKLPIFFQKTWNVLFYGRKCFLRNFPIFCHFFEVSYLITHEIYKTFNIYISDNWLCGILSHHHQTFYAWHYERVHVGDGKFYVRLVKDVLSFFCCFGMYVFFLSFQIMLSSNSWKGFQQFSAINVYKVLDVMLKSRADSTTKAYVLVIRKFLGWSKSRHFNMQLPFPLSVVSLYLFEV